jgi:hypothetical protein
MITNNAIQGTRALPIFASDDAEIPTPNLQVNSIMTAKADGGAILVDSTNPFIVNPTGNAQFVVNVGDVVFIPSLSTSVTITEVISASQIRLNVAVANVGLEYQVYQQSAATGNSNTGCYIYPGQGTEGQAMTCLTAGNDYVVFDNIPVGFIFPVKIKKVFSTGTSITNLVAIW